MDPASYKLTFGPYKDRALNDVPPSYVAELGGYRVVDGTPTMEHPFDYLCHYIYKHNHGPCGCRNANNHATTCFFFSYGGSLGITRNMLIDHINNDIVQYEAAKKVSVWVKTYVKYPKDVKAARAYMMHVYAPKHGLLHDSTAW